MMISSGVAMQNKGVPLLTISLLKQLLVARHYFLTWILVCWLLWWKLLLGNSELIRKLCSYAKPTLHWRHNGRDGVSNHRRFDCLLNDLFRCRSTKTSKLRVTGLCEGNSQGTAEFPSQRVNNAEYISIWWRTSGSIILTLSSWYIPDPVGQGLIASLCPIGRGPNNNYM